MIPFASQRAGGQDLATHLSNAQDNEYIEVAQVRGAIARDLHGAFAEWEAQAHALTRCRQYLCSLSVNPDELQGRLTRDQYLDYIDRAEAKLGLTGQPRAVIFHMKEDGRGRMRRLRSERAQRAPKGLAAFLGRVTGVALITKKVQRYRDGKRFEAYLETKQQLAERQHEHQAMLARRHELQRADMDRRLRALAQIDKRELASIEQSRLSERRRQINARHPHMPVFSLEAKPPGRPAAPHKAKNRYISPVRRELEELDAQQGPRKDRKIAIKEEFEKVAGDDGGRDDSGGGAAAAAASGAPQPEAAPTIARRKLKDTERLREFNEAASQREDDDSRDEGAAEAPAPEREAKIRRRKRRRDQEKEASPERGRDDPGRESRRRRKDRDPPDLDDPPQPRRTRRRDFDRGM